MPAWLDQLLLDATDALFARRRYPLPPPARLEACRIVSHRGERNDSAVLENTYAAFDPLRGSGVHGIEFDVRWTADLVPVVYHDPDLQRLHGDPARLSDLSWAELHARRPEIPDLRAFVQRYAAEFHLMCEVKEERFPQPARQSALLAEALAPALERRRCTVLCLAPEMFGALRDIPASVTMGVSRLDTGSVSAEALAHGRFGISGHFALLGEGLIARHHAAGQQVGCGFPASRGVFYREVGRGVDWIFTNRALQALAWRREALAQAPPSPPGTPAPPH